MSTPFSFTDQEEDAAMQDLSGIEVPQRLGGYYAPTPEISEDYAEVFSEAEKRFAKAQFYRTLLVDFGFDGDNSAIATQVVDEIRGFVRERLAVLLGVKSEQTAPVVVASDFSEEEVKILKQVAGRLLKKPEIAKIEPPRAPTMKKVAGPAKPTIKPTPAPQAQQPQPVPEAQKRGPGRPKKDGAKTGEYLEVDGVRYEKVVGDTRGEYYSGPDGQKYVVGRNEANQMFMKNVTPPGVPSTFKPVPRLTGDMMAAISSRHVSQALRSDTTGVTQTAANITLVKG